MGKRYAIVGFGCAGYHGLEALRQSDPGSEIHVFSELDQPPANPMLTTYYAAGGCPLRRCSPLAAWRKWRGGSPPSSTWTPG